MTFPILLTAFVLSVKLQIVAPFPAGNATLRHRCRSWGVTDCRPSLSKKTSRVLIGATRSLARGRRCQGRHHKQVLHVKTKLGGGAPKMTTNPRKYVQIWHKGWRTSGIFNDMFGEVNSRTWNSAGNSALPQMDVCCQGSHTGAMGLVSHAACKRDIHRPASSPSRPLRYGGSAFTAWDVALEAATTPCPLPYTRYWAPRGQSRG